MNQLLILKTQVDMIFTRGVKTELVEYALDCYGFLIASHTTLDILDFANLIESYGSHARTKEIVKHIRENYVS